MEKIKAQKRQFTGTVVSDKMKKTVTVKVSRTLMHPKYGKRYTVSAKFKAHDEKSECKVNDVVLIEECRPLSRDKRFRVIKVLEKAITL
jgi:small subunit ribosomal protein S17